MADDDVDELSELVVPVVLVTVVLLVALVLLRVVLGAALIVPILNNTIRTVTRSKDSIARSIQPPPCGNLMLTMKSSKPRK